MYPWKNVRTLCLVLLLIPIAHFVYVAARDTLANMNSSPEVWAGEVEAYAAANQNSSAPNNPVIIVGGQRVRRWQGLEDILAPRPVLMRGLGNAIVEDITHNYSALVGHNRPQAVVFLPGDSEFHIRDNKDADDLVSAIRDLVALDAKLIATERFYIFTPLKTRTHPRDHAKIDRTTQLLKEWSAGNERIHIIDANTLLTDASGAPRPQYFRGDGIQLNERGYLRLSMMLESVLEAEEATST